MGLFLKVIGIVMIGWGTMLGVNVAEPITVIVSILGGCVLMALGQFVDIFEDMRNRHSLELPLSKQQVRTIIRHSTRYQFISNDLKLYSGDRKEYPLVLLEGEQYIRASLFHEYMAIDINEYTFAFPERASVILHSHYSYYPGVELFELDDALFVKVTSLGITLTLHQNCMMIGY
ncbi:hypothetical protein [Paenibacillus marinisediminis]